MLMQEERERIVEYGKLCSSSGLCPGTSGNLSIYNAEQGYMAISPSGMDYFSICPDDIVITDLDANIIDGFRQPSSEWALHTAFYKRKPHVRAVVHTHSVYCTTLSILGQPVRAVHYVIGDANSHFIPCAPYRIFGSAALAETAVSTAGDSDAVLLSNHGMVACGKNIAAAFSLAHNAEYVAKLQILASCVGKPNVLTPQQTAEVLEKFRSYGQPDSHKTGY